MTVPPRTSEPVVSVVIPAHNAARFLREALESALAQTHPHVEVIVVDDGSTDETPEILRGYGARIRSIRQDTRGVSVARNRGIAAARGELIAFLDADDVWEPDKIERQLRALQQHPEAGLVYSPESRIDERGRPTASGSRRPGPSGWIAGPLFLQNFIPTSTVIVRRRCLEEVGEFHGTDGLVLGQDYDMWLRIAERYEVAFVNRPLARYRVYEAGISKRVDRAYEGERLTVERAIRRAGGTLAPLARRRYAQLYFEWGYEYFQRGDFRTARRRFARSLAFSPQCARTWAYLAVAASGPAGAAGARWLKRRVLGANQKGSSSLFQRPAIAAQGVSKKGAAPISVLHVLNTLEMGGAEQVVLNLARHIDRQAFEMQVCGLGGEGPLAEPFRRLGVRVHAMHRRPGVDLDLCLRLARLVRRERIDVVHTHNAGPWLYGGLAARLAGARLVHTEHSNLFPSQRRLQRAERWLARLTDVIIADSEKVRRQLVEGQGVPSARVRVVVNGVDTRRFNGGPGSPEARQALHVNGGLVIGTVGRLVPVKDHRTLLEAFRRVAEARPASYLVLIGDGPLRGELVCLAGSLGIGERVRFLGERQDIPALLPAFDLFVLSSVSEGMPLTILEAMAAGKPVVATNVGGVAEAVVEEETGLLVPPRDPERLAQALLRLLADEPLRAACGQAGSARVRERFDLRRMVETYESAYRH